MYYPEYENYGAVVASPGATRITFITGAEEVAQNSIIEIEWRVSTPYKAYRELFDLGFKITIPKPN